MINTLLIMLNLCHSHVTSHGSSMAILLIYKHILSRPTRVMISLVILGLMIHSTTLNKALYIVNTKAYRALSWATMALKSIAWQDTMLSHFVDLHFGNFEYFGNITCRKKIIHNFLSMHHVKKCTKCTFSTTALAFAF